MNVRIPGEGEVVIPNDEIKRLKKLLKEGKNVGAFDLHHGTISELAALALNRGIGKLEDELTRVKLAKKLNEMEKESKQNE
ncbi:hypothetical protein [Melghirimyces algeriensis]|uniref:Uncharacterized protein n=1 Tax=Melghirimyces algeriensis TaxID=910412 RepID=A0A521E2K6_9BACL|nr:hypothetical protein [Melghirimyces algeriensis]SMO78194.1 hypothetical protein SAMN06264849_107155 [Melghirimyces algeriensis]